VAVVGCALYCQSTALVLSAVAQTNAGWWLALILSVLGAAQQRIHTLTYMQNIFALHEVHADDYVYAVWQVHDVIIIFM
jgi:hypothetical protein